MLAALALLDRFRAAFANAARIDFAGSRCRRFRHTLKRFGSFARHDLAKLIFVSDKAKAIMSIPYFLKNAAETAQR